MQDVFISFRQILLCWLAAVPVNQPPGLSVNHLIRIKFIFQQLMDNTKRAQIDGYSLLFYGCDIELCHSKSHSASRPSTASRLSTQSFNFSILLEIVLSPQPSDGLAPCLLDYAGC